MTVYNVLFEAIAVCLCVIGVVSSSTFIIIAVLVLFEYFINPLILYDGAYVVIGAMTSYFYE